ncbi:MAG: ABC transporter ATP-binding protein [Elusimicrobiota bacterium]|jgi:lipoprotein-releasing system ATP-binding protein|nr:ABC transporter ATP-binding protein [Elusimicrobiota bacterium]
MNIKVENLSKSYIKDKKNKIEVLKNVNLEISDREKIALVGPSGAGKSTLLQILGMMDRPSAGKVFMAGQDCFAKSDAQLCKMRKDFVGFVFQFHYLMPDFTVFENILLPVWKTKKEKLDIAVKILKKIGLEHRSRHFPSELSGGEQQRAALARALINSPEIIFADEPTGNLDHKTGLEIADILFDSANENKSTLILVTHSEELAKKADRIIRISDGYLS